MFRTRRGRLLLGLCAVWLAPSFGYGAAHAASATTKRAPSHGAATSSKSVPTSPAAATVRAERAPCSPGLTIDWRFETGSALSAPAVSSVDGVYLTSQEGAVHALESSGKLRWTYTVEGRLPWGLDMDAASSIFLASASGPLYALNERGSLLWKSLSRVRPTGQAVLSRDGQLFIPAGRVLRAAPTHTGTPWAMDVGAEIVSGPVADAEGWVWLVTRDNMLQRIKTTLIRKRYALPPDTPTVSGRGVIRATQRVSVLSGDLLSVFTFDGKLVFRRNGVRFVNATAEIVVDENNNVIALEPSSGTELWKRALNGVASDAPLWLAPAAYVPMTDGTLRRYTKDGAEEFCRVAESSLLTPTFAPHPGYILATAGSGVLAAIRSRGAKE